MRKIMSIVKKIVKNIAFCFRNTWDNSREYFFATVIKNVFTAIIPLVNIAGLGFTINALVSKEPLASVLKYIFGYALIHLAITLATQLLWLWESNAMRKSSNILQFKYIQDCLDIDYHYVQDGKILNLKQKSMMSQPPFFLSHWGDVINYFIQSISVLFVFSIFSPIFTLIILFLSVLMILLTIYTQKCDFNFNNNKVEEDRKLDYLYNVMTDYQYAKEIRINNADQFIKNKYIFETKIQIKKLKKLLNKKLGVNSLSVILSIIQTGFMYLYFSHQVFVRQISIAEYSVLISSATLFTSVLLSLFSSLGFINNSFKALEFYREYEQILKDNRTLSQSNTLSEINMDFSKANFKFENVSFMYPDATEYVLKNITLDINAGKKYAIVGLNGSGKTTIIKLILRIYLPTSGRITLNGIDINEIPYRQYISKIACVMQDFALFAYSIKENVIFDGRFDEIRFCDCINKSGLKEKINDLPYGINTSLYRELDDAGIEFSGGEGQKLAMARALYKKADIIILDEPTSALDPIAEYELFMRFNEITDNKTTIYVSHRLSSTKFCDEIIVIHHNEIAERGTHQTLVEKGGLYASLYASQSKYYQESEAKSNDTSI